MHPRRFREKLLAWFDSHGRKTLPWQQHKTPYRVWVSEVMLQQTQVQTVIPYFERFMAQFPTLEALAGANEDAVLHLWAGLGYYSRGRNLHRAALQILNQYQGVFPETSESLQSLPGIGRSTAGAILAIAFQKKAAILDGNVKRVLSRLHGIDRPINDKAVEQDLWSLAHFYTPKKRVDDYTQAMMDLGATICTRSKPACHRCPFRQHCVAFQQALTTVLPIKNKPKPLPIKSMTFLLLVNQDKTILLKKRPDKGVWGGLWSLPELPGEADEQGILDFCRQAYGLQTAQLTRLTRFKHTFTHFHLLLFPVAVYTRQSINLETPAHIWYHAQKSAKVGLPKPIDQILRSFWHDTTNLLHQTA